MALAYVLIVDDEVQFVEAMVERLTIRDFQVASALRGPQALALLAKEPDIEVVVLDLKMPGMDGLEILKAIKIEPPFVHGIMLTGYSTIETVTAAMKLGAFDYLLKPYDMEKMVSLINEAAARKRNFDEQIREARMIPYISERDRQELIDRIEAAAVTCRRSEV
ncbi:MAG: response regulator [Deltaproteobacteria bacterium]|nr:response regulator [Deltaproteobacteria bacterium]